MKRCQSCGRGIGRGTHCELPTEGRLCGEVARVDERARLVLLPGVLLKEDLVSVARSSNSFISATTLERECKKHPHDNVYGLLAFEKEHAEFIACSLFEPWRSRFLESCEVQRARALVMEVERSFEMYVDGLVDVDLLPADVLPPFLGVDLGKEDSVSVLTVFEREGLGAHKVVEQVRVDQLKAKFNSAWIAELVPLLEREGVEVVEVGVPHLVGCSCLNKLAHPWERFPR